MIELNRLNIINNDILTPNIAGADPDPWTPPPPPTPPPFCWGGGGGVHDTGFSTLGPNLDPSGPLPHVACGPMLDHSGGSGGVLGA